MARNTIVAALGILMMSSLAMADGGRKNVDVYKDVSKAVRHYSQMSIFDSVDIGVQNGVVTLRGDVTMPYKRTQIERLTAKIDGVAQVNNEISVLPVSNLDDQIRIRIARSFFTNPFLVTYERGVDPSIHIVVDHGHVTLTGVVNSAADRQLASVVANQFPAFSVTNDLKTEAEVRTALEHLD